MYKMRKCEKEFDLHFDHISVNNIYQCFNSRWLARSIVNIADL